MAHEVGVFTKVGTHNTGVSSTGSKEGQVKSEDFGRDIASVQGLLAKQVTIATPLVQWCMLTGVCFCCRKHLKLV